MGGVSSLYCMSPTQQLLAYIATCLHYRLYSIAVQCAWPTPTSESLELVITGNMHNTPCGCNVIVIELMLTGNKQGIHYVSGVGALSTLGRY